MSIFHDNPHFFLIFCLNFEMFSLYLPNKIERYQDFINQLIHKIMNKTELIEKIAAGSGLSKVAAKKALDSTVDAIKEALVAGDKVQLIGFGTFSVSERPARVGVNPAKKGEKINIPAKKVAKFKVGAELADAVK